MKALFNFWWQKVDKLRRDNDIAFITVVSIVVSAAVQLFLPGAVPIFSLGAYKGDTILQLAIICIKIIAFLGIIFFIGRVALSFKHIFRAIRFRRWFGFWPPSTDDGLFGVKVPVFCVLNRFAERLDASYEAENRMSLELRDSNDAEHILALERNLRQAKRDSKDLKREFYSRRDLAKAVGVETHKSYKDYLTTRFSDDNKYEKREL